MNKFTSKGHVYGLDRSGAEACYSTPYLESNDYDDIILQINEKLDNGALDDEGRLQKLYGAIMHIESTTQDEDGKISFISNYVEFGKLTEKQSNLVYKQIFNEMFDVQDDTFEEGL